MNIGNTPLPDWKQRCVFGGKEETVMIVRKPKYYDAFRCVAGACPDSCCHEWEVQVDEKTAAFYRGLTGSLADALREVLGADNTMALREGRCPMWRADGLCRIQAELGERALCDVCRTFPRICHDYGSFQEKMLEMSCPEAARLIFLSDGEWEETEAAGETEADYDLEDMALLLSSRERAFRILTEPGKPEEILVKLLLLGIRTQNALDGVQTEYSAEEICRAAVPGDIRQIAGFFRKLEILTPRWERLLEAVQAQPLPRAVIPMTRYLVSRYWLHAVSDLDLYGRVKFITVSAVLVGSLGGDFEANAQLWSKEIENDAQNVDAILDGAYTSDALSDGKLLGLLLGKREE